MNSSVKRLAVRIAVLVTMLPMSAVCAWPQLKPCSPSLPAGPYKIFVDGMRTDANSSEAQELKNLKARISAAVENNLAEIKMQLLDTQLKQQKTLAEIQVIPCNDARFPSSIAAFSDREMRTLSESRVLLEIWGDVQSAEAGTAYMGYALAPAFKVRLPAVYSIRESLGRPSTSAEQLFKENKTLKAYAEVVVGIQFYRNDDFDAAVGYLCGGALKLESALASRPKASAPEEQLFVKQQQQLIEGVRSLGSDAIRKAAANPGSTVTAVSGGASTCPGKEN